jgi:hypothetical protein
MSECVDFTTGARPSVIARSIVWVFLSYNEVSGSSAISATNSTLATGIKGVHATLEEGGKRSIEGRNKNAETRKRTEFHPRPARSHILSS